uniref:Uncharacterized protein n=1 Tax=Anguilla anguilla TaxID=7936 RepID=A0A0E9R3U8_ANGAN
MSHIRQGLPTSADHKSTL